MTAERLAARPVSSPRPVPAGTPLIVSKGLTIGYTLHRERKKLTALRDIREALKKPTLPGEAFMVGEASDEVLQRQASALEAARARLTSLGTEYNAGSVEIKRTEAEVKAQLDSIRSYVNAKIARAEKQVGALNKVISEHEAKLATIPGAELAVSQLGRESEVYSRMYSFLLERRQQAAITKASTPGAATTPRISRRENATPDRRSLGVRR